MAKKRKTCLPKPAITLKRAKTPRARRQPAAPETKRDYVLCAAADADCGSRAKSGGYGVAKLAKAKPTEQRPGGFTFESKAKPCSGDRFSKRDPNKCPVQVFWKNGTMRLRLCDKQGAKGKVLEIGTDARKASELTARACAHWAQRLSWSGFADDAGLGGGAR